MKKIPKLSRVAIYIRVSTDMQAKKGDSLAEQSDTLHKYVADGDDLVLHSVYVDDGISGQKIKRDEFSRLMDDVDRGLVDLIIFTKLDRWFRSLRHYLNTQATLEKRGVGWLAVSQPFYDTTTAQGRAFVAQSMTFAELEAQIGSERILSTFDYKVKIGEVISGNTPLGYDVIDKRLSPNSDADKVVAMYLQYKKLPSIRALMRYAADELGIVRGHSQFRRILANTKYKGVFRDNQNYCPALVSVDLWEDCNRLISRNQRSNKSHDYIFSGLLTCGECGRKLNACTIYHRKHRGASDTIALDGTDSHYRYPAYRCQGKNNGLGCVSTKQFYEKTLEKKLLEILIPTLEGYISDYDVNTSPVIDAEKKRKALESKVLKLKELYINDFISLDEYKKDRAHYEELISSFPQEERPRKDLTLVRSILEYDFLLVYPAMDVVAKNEFWRSFLSEILIYNNHKIELIFC